MANITPYLRNRLVQQSLGISASPSWHTATYVGLFVTSPIINNDGTITNGVEVYAGSGYSRTPVYAASANGSPYWTINSTTGAMSNTGTTPSTNGKISFGTASGYWAGTASPTASIPIVAMGVWDALSAGNLLWFGPLSAPVMMASGDTFDISAGSLVITLT
jgi:hypothetical protein